MNEAELATVVIHGVVAAFLAMGGFFCLYWGYRLLFNPTPLASQSKFQATLGGHKLAFTAGAAGTAVVFISSIWVAGSVFALPKFSAGGVTVASASIPFEGRIPFQGSVASLEPSQKELLDAYWPVLSRSKGPVVIEGYANTGDAEANRMLASHMAQEVKEYLVTTHKLPADKIETVGYGKEAPRKDMPTNFVLIRSER